MKKTGFLDFLNNYRKKKGKKNPMAELQIELKLSLQIPEMAAKHQQPIVSAKEVHGSAVFRNLRNDLSRYVRNGLRRKPRQIRTAYGLFGYREGRVLDKETKKTFGPLWQAIGLPAYRKHDGGKH